METYDRQATVDALAGALPYIGLFRGKTFVVKASGSILDVEGALEGLLQQVAVLVAVGIRVVLVHGGGPQTTVLSRRMGIEPRMVEGRRVTDEATLAASVMSLNGTVSTTFQAISRKVGLMAVPLSGVSAGLITAHRRPPVERAVEGRAETLDYGHVGDVDRVDPGPLVCLLDAGLVPVVSPLSADAEGSLLNINADTVAAALAVALGAEKLVLLTPSAGLLRDVADVSSLVPQADLSDLDTLEAQGVVRNGMRPKIKAAREALMGGVPRVHLVGVAAPGALLLEVFTNEGAGTLLVKAREAAPTP